MEQKVNPSMIYHTDLNLMVNEYCGMQKLTRMSAVAVIPCSYVN